MSESTTQKAVTDFYTAIVEVFGPERLREPTEDDLRSILAVISHGGFWDASAALTANINHGRTAM